MAERRQASVLEARLEVVPTRGIELATGLYHRRSAAAPGKRRHSPVAICPDEGLVGPGGGVVVVLLDDRRGGEVDGMRYHWRGPVRWWVVRWWGCVRWWVVRWWVACDRGQGVRRFGVDGARVPRLRGMMGIRGEAGYQGYYSGEKGFSPGY